MRLWHYKLLPYLPNSQIKGQWRELCAIFKDSPKHILINYIYEYGKEDLFEYSAMVEKEMVKRHIRFSYPEYYFAYFQDLKDRFRTVKVTEVNPFPNHHNHRYLLQCYYNLQEKYDRKQKDFTDKCYMDLYTFVLKEIENESKGINL